MAEKTPLRILGISGSLRAKSCNTGLLRAAQAVGGKHGFQMDILEYQDLMVFNQVSAESQHVFYLSVLHINE